MNAIKKKAKLLENFQKPSKEEEQQQIKSSTQRFAYQITLNQ